ncbi:MAG: hypothetical protein ABJK37_07055 [Paraglaciecola sp.]|uniref:hypothetical protein n=1 Tax=Paraglaciecola sp. TaxID=1920173 RepID=UPI00329689A1
MKDKNSLFCGAASKFPNALKDEIYSLYTRNISNSVEKNRLLFNDFADVLNDSEFVNIMLSFVEEGCNPNLVKSSEYSHLLEFLKIAIAKWPQADLQDNEKRKLKEYQVKAAKKFLGALKKGLYDPNLAELVSMVSTSPDIGQRRISELTQFRKGQENMSDKYKLYCEQNECERDFYSTVIAKFQPSLSELLNGYITALSEDYRESGNSCEAKDEEFLCDTPFSKYDQVVNRAKHDASYRLNMAYDATSKAFDSYKEHLIFERRLFSHCEAVFGRIPICVEDFHDWMFNAEKTKFSTGDTRSWTDAKSDFNRFKKQFF